jgi:N-acetylneuraminic acid mutarotase
LVGASNDDDNGSGSGSAYIYHYDPNTDTWAETKLLASDGATFDKFGASVAINGHIALVGAYSNGDFGSGTGSAYIYQYDPNTDTWGETKVLAPDASAGDEFGWSVAISGHIALIGAPRDNDNGGDSGSAYLLPANP